MDQPGFFGEWLRQRRQALDLTRPELAQCAGCSVSALRKIETGERRPSKQLAGLLAECLTIPADDRSAFVRVARGELRDDRLGPPILALIPEHKLPAPHSNLPLLPTPLVGRESELATLTQLLRDPECRLLTVVGPGGIGKTRLAIEAASAGRKNFADGVCFVPLASLSAPEFIVPAIVDALGLAVYSSTDPVVQLLNHLRAKSLLLVMDSTEHLVAGLGIVSELLEGAPGVKALLTSRQRSGLRGEWVLELQGLPVPPVGQEEGLQEYSSVVLFLQLAQRAQAGAHLAAEELPAVGQICRLLEGMPLGIELAAAWVRVLSCQEIAEEIERNMDFLATTVGDAPQRHRSLRTVFDHSWRLLSEEEQGVLRRLAIFRGEFRRQAAEQVAGATLPLLMALVDKSLLRRNESGRYDLHELVRQGARARLEETPQELDEAADRHSAYYASLLQELGGDLQGERQPEALAEISAEIDDVRLAWRWAVTGGQAAAIEKPIRALWIFYDMRGQFQEAESLFRWAGEELERVMSASGDPDLSLEVLAAYVRANQGWFCLKLGRFEESQQLLQPSLAALRSRGTDAQVADALYFLGAVEWLTGDFAGARAHFLETLALAEQMGDRWRAGLAHGNIGLVAYTTGEYEESQERWQRALAINRQLGDRRMVAAALHFAGRLKCTLGAYDEARAYLRESLMLSGTLGDRWTHALALGQLARLARALGEHREAVDLFRQSLSLARQIGEGWSILQALNGLGAAALTLGQYDEARSALCEALALAQEMQALPEALDALAGLAEWRARQGELEAALAQAVAVLRHPAADQETKTQAARLRTALEAELAPQQVAAVEAAAQATSLEALVAELLDAPPTGAL